MLLSCDSLQSQQEEEGVDVTGMVAAPLPVNPLRESLEEGDRDGELKEEGKCVCVCVRERERDS